MGKSSTRAQNKYIAKAYMSGGNSTGQLEKARKGKAPGIRAGRDFRRGTGPTRTEAQE